MHASLKDQLLANKIEFISNHQIKNAIIKIYNFNNKLNYELISSNVKYLPDKKTTYFSKLIVYVFNARKILIWKIKSDSAKLIQNKILYLYGCVQINNFNKNAYIQYVITKNARLDLIKQEFLSENIVKTCGTNLNSIGNLININLNNKTVKLIGNVKSLYEIQK